MIVKGIRVKIFLIIACTLFLGSCSSNEEETDLSEQFLNTSHFISDEYETKEINIEDIGLTKPVSFEVVGEKIFIADAGANEIKIFDKKWNYIETVSNDQIATPHLLAFESDNLAVLDGSTNQVIIFDLLAKDKVQQFSLPSISKETNYKDMMLTKTDIWLTYDTPILEESNLIKISRDSGDIEIVAEKFNGYIGNDIAKIQLINSLVPYQKPGEQGFEVGNNSLWEVQEENELRNLGGLIETSQPTDFFVKDGILFVFTAGWASIDRYDKNLEYIDSLATFEFSDEALLKGDQDWMILLMPNENKLYEVMKK